MPAMPLVAKFAGMLLGAMFGAFVLGLAGFTIGVFGPLLLMPEANQGPLIALAAGPLGAMAGAVIGGIIGWRLS